MKTIVKILLGMFIFLNSVPVLGNGDPTDVLEVRGFFITKSNVEYEVCLIEIDSICTPVKVKRGWRTYEVKLEIGQMYVIKFTKDSLVKELFIEVTEPGDYEIDVDFTTDNSATMKYDPCRREYVMAVLLNDEAYVAEGNYHPIRQ